MLTHASKFVKPFLCEIIGNTKKTSGHAAFLVLYREKTLSEGEYFTNRYNFHWTFYDIIDPFDF